jgi:hypothetical protein
MIFLFFTLPETKDKQLEEVETLFETPWCVCGKSGSFEINLSSICQALFFNIMWGQLCTLTPLPLCSSNDIAEILLRLALNTK